MAASEGNASIRLPGLVALMLGAAGMSSVFAVEPTKGAAPAGSVQIAASSPLVSFRFVFRAGSQDDPRGKEGLAALTAAMVSEGGTRNRTYEQLLEAFYPMAG